jgi:hypothetical protein
MAVEYITIFYMVGKMYKYRMLDMKNELTFASGAVCHEIGTQAPLIWTNS